MNKKQREEMMKAEIHPELKRILDELRDRVRKWKQDHPAEDKK